MKIIGDVRPGKDFQITTKPTNLASSTFAALTSDGLLVTRRLADLWRFSDDTPVLAHWHGESRTDGFATTVGEIKSKALEAGYTLDH
jgi:hypothetical protein